MGDVKDSDFERFALIVNGPALFNAILAGMELGVFRCLEEQPKTRAGRLASDLKLPAHQLRVLLHALCVSGLIDHEDGAYFNTPLSSDMLVQEGPDSWERILKGWQQIYYPAFPYLTDAIRTGRNVALRDFPGDEPTLYQRLRHDRDLERVFHQAMSAFTLRSMDGLFDNIDLQSTDQVLDIGGGDGTTARCIAARFPNVKVTVLDLPSVVDLGANTAEVDRVAFQDGDILTEDFPTGMNVVLFSHVLEVFPSDAILALASKAYDSLPSGGKVFIYGFNAEDDERSGPFSARLSLYLNTLASGCGMTYPHTDYEAWLSDVGFQEVGSKIGLPYEHALTSGRKE